jgi:hypothetical protein
MWPWDEAPRDLPEVWARLQAAGATEVHAHWSGSNDEGFVDEVTAVTATGHPVPIADADETAIVAWVEEQLPDGWEINEGGYGRLKRVLATTECKVEHHQRDPEPEDAYDDDDGW